MTYTRLANREIINGDVGLNIFKEIDQKEIDELFEYQKPITEYKHLKNLYRITISNGNQLQSFLKAVYSNDQSIEHMTSEILYLEGNRLIANYCSFIGMFIDQVEKVLTKKDEEKLKDFRATCSKLYDQNFEYRFFVLLRNFIMHYSLPFTRYHEDFNGKRLEFSKNHLLNFSKWKHVKQEIQDMNESIDIQPYITPMNANLTVLLYDVVYQLSQEILNAYQAMSDFSLKHKVRSPAIVRYNSIEELKTGKISYTPIDFEDLQSALDDVKNHPKINLNINEIKPDF